MITSESKLTSESQLVEEISDEEIRSLAHHFENVPPEEVLRWAIEEFGFDVALATGFGVEGCVLIDMLSRVDPKARIFFIDTYLLFPETYELIAQLASRYHVPFEQLTPKLSLTAQAASFGDKLWERQPDKCCELRKVEPLLEKLADLRAWITAIRRDQSHARAGAKVIERDQKFGLIKVNPLVVWSSVDVWRYIFKHDVPYNPLHDRGFPSIGCTPCTSPVQPGEDPRAGRWRGQVKTECGLHGR